jgi:hypothetical protein
VTFNALGGLANRLRAIFSRYAGGLLQPPMQVVWARTWDIAQTHFLQVFEPVPGIEFVPDGTPCDEESWHAAINYSDWHQHYRLLRPTAALRERISGLQSAVGEYIAMHVRRTDHVKLAHMQGRYTEDGEFVQWAHEQSKATPLEPCFLATCNAETRQILARHIGPRLFWQGDLQPSTVYQHESTRYGSLADAVVDLFICVGAREFMGTAHSSFSELVTHLRGLG